jgi:hypothetical protein
VSPVAGVHYGRYSLLWIAHDDRAESMVLITDGTPNPLLRSLEAMYPNSSRVSLSD